MAFKMKGAPMYDTSSKHGTNANYKKSGPPNLLGKILDPLGLKNKLMGGNKSNCPPQQQQVIGGPKPVEPVTPTAPAAAAAAPAAAAPVVPEEVVGGATMKKGLKNGAPMKDLSGDGKITKKDVLIGRGVIEKPGASMKKKAGAPKKIDPPTKPAMHEIKHGEIKIKKAYLGGLRTTKPKMKEQVAKTLKTKMTKEQKLKAIATGGVKGMGVGGAGKKVIGRMTRTLKNNLHKKK